MDYALPRAKDAPAFQFETINVPCKTNPLGVKGAGEAGAIGSCPALINAIIDALYRAYRDPAHRHAGDPAAHLGGNRETRRQGLRRDYGSSKRNLPPLLAGPP